MAHALRMPGRIGDGDGPALGDAEQRKPLEAERVHHGLEIPDPGLEREVLDIPVGEPAPALVVADQRVVPGKLPDPVAPDQALAVHLEMAEPVGGFYQWRPAPDVAYAMPTPSEEVQKRIC